MADPITLEALAPSVAGRVLGDGATLVSDVTHDSRDVGDGSLFAAVRGFVTDGHQFVGEALAAGAVALCVEDEAAVPPGRAAIVVPSVREVLGRLASTVHGNPSSILRVVGITGTNGKTTVAHLIEAIAAAAGIQQAIIGTVGARINGKPFPVERTTPEATDFQRLLAAMVGFGVDIASVEVSSHALALGRVDGTFFEIGAFTNLSQDHLDFHADMEEYLAAKRSLFDRCRTGVIWVDDDAGRHIASEVSIPIVRVGTGDDADVRGRAVAVALDGSTFDVSGPGGGARMHLQLPGRFNMSNALVAAGCMNALGISWDTIADGIGRVASIPGRFEIVPIEKDFTVVVDYAHTPAGVESMVGAARELAVDGRVIVVSGAAGDRDHDKRPLMGAAAATADIAVITSDNPRSEDPETIVAEVAAGAGDDAIRVVDRREAIGVALGLALRGDVVLILGKGHERSQEVAGEFLPFDDRQVALEEASR
ncbi:MAG: UDP-N-acetylmuramoyl-L-alanyl-D-glutamate--2,6-diaminopimelate ligase [Acidimicrobiia bacterium]